MSRVTYSNKANELVLITYADISAWLRYGDKGPVDRKHVERWHEDLKQAVESKEPLRIDRRLKPNTKI